MSLFLQILGAVFVGILVLIAVGILFLRYKLKQIGKALSEFAGAMGAAAQPSRIKLIPVAGAVWEDTEVQNYAAPLSALGFQSIGVFDVQEVDGLRLGAWVNPAEGMYAVIYRHPQAGVWMDFVTKYEDGSSRTHSNAPQGGALEQRPDHENVFLKESTALELHEFALKDRPQKPTRRLAFADFVHDFESAYADEMDWRASKGGVSEREIRAIAAMSGEEYGDSIVEATREIARRQAEDHLQSRLVQEFQTHTKLRVKEWEEVEDRLVFVHDGMPRENLIDLVESWSEAEMDEEDEDALELPANLPSRALFAKLNARLPQERRFRKLDTVAQPVEADVYVAPEGVPDDEDDFDEDDE